jgi:hypothetical protein
LLLLFLGLGGEEGCAVTVFPMESHNTLRSWPILCRQQGARIVRHAMRIIVTRRDFI